MEDATDPDWSPDGTKIAFASDRVGDYETFAMSADGPMTAEELPAQRSRSPAGGGV